MVSVATVLAIGAVISILCGFGSLWKRWAASDDNERRLLAGGAGVGAGLALGFGLAAGFGSGLVHAGWGLAALAGVVVLADAAGVDRGALWVAIALDAVAVVLFAGAAGEPALAGYGAETTALALVAGGAFVVLGIVVVLLRPFSRSASGLSSDGAAAFSVLRNVLIGGWVLWATAAVAVTGLELGPIATAGFSVAIGVLIAGMFTWLLATTSGALAAGEGAAWTG